VNNKHNKVDPSGTYSQEAEAVVDNCQVALLALRLNNQAGAAGEENREVFHEEVQQVMVQKIIPWVLRLEHPTLVGEYVPPAHGVSEIQEWRPYSTEREQVQEYR
jgi:hypothetical protein